MLAPHESHLIDTLRAVEPTRQPAMARACSELIELSERHLTCPGIGVDGFPCGSPMDTCENCRQLVTTLESLSLGSL